MSYLSKLSTGAFGGLFSQAQGLGNNAYQAQAEAIQNQDQYSSLQDVSRRYGILTSTGTNPGTIKVTNYEEWDAARDVMKSEVQMLDDRVNAMRVRLAA